MEEEIDDNEHELIDILKEIEGFKEQVSNLEDQIDGIKDLQIQQDESLDLFW